MSHEEVWVKGRFPSQGVKCHEVRLECRGGTCFPTLVGGPGPGWPVQWSQRNQLVVQQMRLWLPCQSTPSTHDGLCSATCVGTNVAEALKGPRKAIRAEDYMGEITALVQVRYGVAISWVITIVRRPPGTGTGCYKTFYRADLNYIGD